MIKFIIGNNASGKTLYLDNCIDIELENISKSGLQFITNLRNGNYSNRSYDKERIHILKELTQCTEIDITSALLSFIGSPVRLSEDFIKLMTLMCKESKRAYIDEPEQGLSIYELNLFCSFLDYAGRTYEELVIVTHSELLIQTDDKELFTPIMDEKTADLQMIQIDEENKFEVID